MKIAVLSHNSNAYTRRRFTEAAKKRGHDMRFIHISYCYMNISTTSPTVYYGNAETFETLDAIIPRIKPNHTVYGTGVLRQFELMNVYTLNSSIAITWSRDKLRTMQILARKNLPLLITGFADSPEETEKLIELVGGVPLIVRLLEGTQGRGTVLAETHQAAVSVINAFKQLKTNILIQEFIKEANGMDIRCMVVGNQVIAAIERNAPNVEVHAAHHTALTITPIQITDAEKKIAIRAAKSMKLNLASVDLIRSKRGPLVLDIECSPSIELFEKITDADITGHIIEFIEKSAE